MGGSAFLQRGESWFGPRLQQCYKMTLIMVTISFPDGLFENQNRNSANLRDCDQFFTRGLMTFRDSETNNLMLSNSEMIPLLRRGGAIHWGYTRHACSDDQARTYAVECALNFILNCYRVFFTFTIVLLLYAEIHQSIVNELRVEGLNYFDPESAVLRSQNRKLSMICC